jgi:hypothetical protein
MKTNMKRTILIGLMAVSVMLFSFTMPRGGDSFQVYFNGKLMLQQFVHADKSVKSLQLNPVSENDKIDVYYSHCGAVGKNRFLTIKDENDNPVHVWEFPDASNGNGAMSFTVKQVWAVLKNKAASFSISYSSKELPNGKPLAMINMETNGLSRN